LIEAVSVKDDEIAITLRQEWNVKNVRELEVQLKTEKWKTSSA
jgi:hypothetical protein